MVFHHLWSPLNPDISFTNVPNIRVAYRYDTLKEELTLVTKLTEHVTQLLPMSIYFLNAKEGFISSIISQL